jgi:mono/diheme cytochrome c family protein
MTTTTQGKGRFVTLSPCHLVTLSVFLLAGCGDLPGKPREEDRPRRPDQEDRFDVLFQEHCQGCHGVDGRRGPAPPLHDDIFLAIVTEDDLLDVITNGREAFGSDRTPMPAFAQSKGGPLTEKQVRILTKGMHKKWGGGQAPEGRPRYRKPASEPPGDAAKGKELFARACAGCHGEHGDNPRLRLNDPAFLGLVSDQTLRRYIITGRHDLAKTMPSYHKHEPPLSPRDVTDLTAYLASWRRREQGGGGP